MMSTRHATTPTKSRTINARVRAIGAADALGSGLAVENPIRASVEDRTVTSAYLKLSAKNASRTCTKRGVSGGRFATSTKSVSKSQLRPGGL